MDDGDAETARFVFTQNHLPMKRFLSFLFVAAALVAGGCSDSGTDGPIFPDIPDPVINVSFGSSSTFSAPPEGGTVRIEYEIENPAEGGGTISAVSLDTWVHSFDTSKAGEISFTADPSAGEMRIANVTLSYPNAKDVTVTVMQNAPEIPALTFDIQVPSKDGSSAVVTWTPSDNSVSYLAMVVEKSIFDGYATEAEYIQSDIEYIQWLASQNEMTFSEVLAQLLTTGPSGEQTIDGLKSDTDYYAYAYGMTAEGVATSAITKTAFRTEAFSCEFSIAHEETDSTCDVEVTPSNTGCFYYFDLASKADIDTWGTDTEIIASVIASLKETVASYQTAGYDITLADLLSIGPDSYTFKSLSPETDYEVYAFALTEEGEPLTGLTRQAVRTKSFVVTDNCTFGISFSNVSATAFDISVQPSDPATRYYIGVCTKKLYDENTPASIADAFIEMENGYKIDWAGNEYIWTGNVTVNSKTDLFTSMDPETDYVTVVFGISTEGVRTTEVASAVQKTAAPQASSMTIGMQVRDITYDGAVVDIHPSSADEDYYVDCIPYASYASFAGDNAALIQALIDQAGGYIQYYLMKGDQELDTRGYLLPETKYITVAFGYAGAATTPLFVSEPFTTLQKPISTATIDINVTVEDGDDYFAADAEKYADFKGKAVLYGEITHSADAAKWYVAAFSGDISGNSDADVESYLLSKGYENREAVLFLLDWGGQLTFVGVAVDADGVSGPVVRKIVPAQKNTTASSMKSMHAIARIPGGKTRIEIGQSVDRMPAKLLLPTEHATQLPAVVRPVFKPRVSLEMSTFSARGTLARFSSVAELRGLSSQASRKSIGMEFRLRRF